jgi:hypothetical protein
MKARKKKVFEGWGHDGKGLKVNYFGYYEFDSLIFKEPPITESSHEKKFRITIEELN